MLITISVILLMLLLLANVVQFQELIRAEPSFKYIYESFKKESIFFMLVYVLHIPAILVYAIVKFFMWKPFGE